MSEHVNRSGASDNQPTSKSRARLAAGLGIAAVLAFAAVGCSDAGTGAGPQIIELGEGQFQLALDPEIGTEPPAWLDGGAMEWEYVGQAVYTRTKDRDVVPSQHKSALGKRKDGARPTGAVMEDEHGRLFRSKKVDDTKLRAMVDAYTKRVHAEIGPEPGVRAKDAPQVNDVEDGPDAKSTILSWSSNGDKSTWDGDDREKVLEPLTTRQEKVVFYALGDAGSDGRFCSGTLIDDYWVLTAAHCVKNSTGTSWIYAEDSNAGDGKTEAYRGRVCTEGNIYSGRSCANVTARTTYETYAGDGDFEYDLAVLQIDEPLGLGNYMALSEASNATLKDNLAYNIGHPGTAPNGTDNIFCPLFVAGASVAGFTSDTYMPCYSYQYWSNGDVSYTSEKLIGTRVDASSGHSGGPIFYYPSGVSPTAAHYLTGVLAGYRDGAFENWNGGPKIPYHRDWIIGIID